MARYELKLPKMGESVAEATVTNWLKGVGDAVSLDEDVLEIATDKVDSGVPSEVSGVLVEMCFEVDQVAQVGDTLAIIETEGAKEGQKEISEPEPEPEPSPPEIVATVAAPLKVNRLDQSSADSRFY